MGHFIGVQTDSADKIIYGYSNITRDELIAFVDSGMQSIGYKNLGNGMYEKGSRLKRILFGAFVKYFKCQIYFDDVDPTQPRICLMKRTSGMSGGIIGMSQAKTEMEYLRKVFQSI